MPQVFENHLFERNFFEHELPTHAVDIGDSAQIFTELRQLAAKITAIESNEAQLEDEVIAPLLNLLGWPYIRQEGFSVQGKNLRPDFTLFKDGKAKELFQQAPKDNKPVDGIVCLLESKAADKQLDTGKAGREQNPYFQLLEYLNYARLPFGFLCNGRELWFVDNSKVFADKSYVKTDFAQLADSRDNKALRQFFHLFARKSHVAEKRSEAPFRKINNLDEDRRRTSEEELRSIIYGTNGRDSIFELCGASLFARSGEKSPLILRDLFNNSLYFVFRLLFIACFEDRCWNILQKHSSYPDCSLRSIHSRLQTADGASFTGWNDLQRLFEALDKGNQNLLIPLFNGGLFDPGRAPLLALSRAMDNNSLKKILDLLYGSDKASSARDFSALSVTHLGAVYEGLLEFEFRIAEEDIYYLEYSDKKSSVEGYFDLLDFHSLDAKNKIQTRRFYKQGSLYMAGSKNSRKASASYYTPASLSFPLAVRAIDHALANLPTNESILSLKLLDNACGSGHILVESLNYLTACGLNRLNAGNDPVLEAALAEEKQHIFDALKEAGFADALIEVDEFAVLKRILLKHVLYGVDIQPFAVELTQLSLWIETFIFGTPLSFIEHHIKTGNSLIGCSRGRFESALRTSEKGKMRQASLLDDKAREVFKKLPAVFRELNSLRDTTAADIEKSKKIYRDKILPTLREMNSYFDILNTKAMLQAEQDASKVLGGGIGKLDSGKEKILSGSLAQLAEILMSKDNANIKSVLEVYRQKYLFFNWALEFPEVFANSEATKNGFHVVIGNPPWDKTKFADTDFFSQYRSNYRSLSNSAKNEAQIDLLTKPYIKARYEHEKKDILTLNNYYKQKFPFNAGAGDGNLFRFFVENNLTLLRQHGTLNFILPTAFMTEDGSINLRKHVLKDFHLLAFDGFENREKLFPDIDIRYKFGLIQIEKDNKQLDAEDKICTCRFMLTNPADLVNDKAFAYSLADIRATSPDHYAFMETKYGRADLDILNQLYNGRFRSLDQEWLDFRNELHATQDKSIFMEKYSDGYLPLYKGACIWQYDSAYWKTTGDKLNSPEYWLDPVKFDKRLLDKEISRLIDEVAQQISASKKQFKERLVLDAVSLKKRKDLARFIVPERTFYRLAFRGVARDTDERTLITTVIPPDISAQHTLYLSIPKHYHYENKIIGIVEIPLKRLFFAQALFNSLIADWMLRFSIGMSVCKTYIYRLPLPQPTDAEIDSNPAYRELVKNSFLLSWHYNKSAFDPLAAKFGFKATDRPQTPKQAMLLRLRNDILVAQIYGIGKTQMEHILKSFTVMNKKSPEYGKTLLDMME